MKKQPRLFSIVQRSLLSRKVLVFFVCLLFSGLFWIITALNKNSQATFRVPVSFINLPKDKVLIGELPKELLLDIKAPGVKLFFLSLKKSLNELVVDFSSLRKLRENVYSFSPANHYYLSKMLNADVEVIRVKPDSLYFTFNNSFFKSVPVKADVMVDFEQMYNLAGKVKSNPSYVVVSGDSTLVKKIDTIYTERIILSSLNKSVKQKARLIYPEEYGKNLFFSANEVMLDINVDKFTDSEIEIPLQVMNAPEGMKVKTFPEHIKIKFQVGMEDYEKISKSMFKAVIDFKNSEPGKNYMKVELAMYPSNVRNIKIIPEKAEFLIKK